jgi:hypothetical protein
MAFETVHTMTDWYDGPRRGVAIVQGQPHLYVSCWTNIDADCDDIFLLSPITEDLFSAALEDWAIWKRWEFAHKNGNASIETHPALPADLERHMEIEKILTQRLVIDEDCKISL